MKMETTMNNYCIPSIKLTSGLGSPETGGCWMTAISVYEESSWSDQPECVDKPIRQLCIKINDLLSSDKVRGEIIGPRLFDPIGTSGNPEFTKKRIEILVDAAVNIWEPMANRYAAGYFVHAAATAAAGAYAADAAAYAAVDAGAAGAVDVAVACAAAGAAAKDKFVIEHILPVLDEMLAVGNRTIIEPSFDERKMKMALQL